MLGLVQRMGTLKGAPLMRRTSDCQPQNGPMAFRHPPISRQLQPWARPCLHRRTGPRGGAEAVSVTRRTCCASSCIVVAVRAGRRNLTLYKSLLPLCPSRRSDRIRFHFPASLCLRLVRRLAYVLHSGCSFGDPGALRNSAKSSYSCQRPAATTLYRCAWLETVIILTDPYPPHLTPCGRQLGSCPHSTLALQCARDASRVPVHFCRIVWPWLLRTKARMARPSQPRRQCRCPSAPTATPRRRRQETP